MAWSLWGALVVACFVISLTPGAGAINTMSNSLTVGARRALWGIAGQQVALVIHLVIVAAGVGLLVINNPVIFTIVRYVGAAYLVWLGIRQLWLSRPGSAVDSDSAETIGGPTRSEPSLHLFRRGLLVNLTNPKAIVFFLAFTPQFIRPEQPLLPQYLVFALTMITIDVLVMWLGFAMAAKTLKRWTSTPHGHRVVARIFGCLFIGVGLLLAFLH